VNKHLIMIFKKSKYLNITIYIFLILIAFLSRYYLFEDRNSWHDEWHSIYVSDPNISNEETFLRYYGDKGDYILSEYYPSLYLFILKYFFKLFGYVDDNGRLLSLIFGVLTIPIAMYLTNALKKGVDYIFVGLLISFNLFLTWQSIEIRAHSILAAVSLINIILFYKILEKKKFFIYLSYFFTSIFLLSLWPLAGSIFFGKTIYLIKDYMINKKKNIIIFLLFCLILIFYVLLNIDYLKYNLARDSHYTVLYDSFFYNYHFRSFFGSKILGGIFLIIFSVFLIKNLKNLFLKHRKEDLLVYIILSSYFLPLMYTLFRASIMSPKYVIFIIPLILIWILINIESKNFQFIKICLVLISMIFFIFNINNSPIDRPPTKEVLKKLSDHEVNLILTNEADVFNNYLKTKKIIIENEIKILKINDTIPNNFEKYWFLCLNNVLHVIGDAGLLSNNPKVDDKCLDAGPKTQFHEIFPRISNIQDFYIRRFEKTFPKK
tara:strand:- start:734 stop:2206 length:1473 start_codon:yes stop_codon:yes gene_type:complete